MKVVKERSELGSGCTNTEKINVLLKHLALLKQQNLQLCGDTNETRRSELSPDKVKALLIQLQKAKQRNSALRQGLTTGQIRQAKTSAHLKKREQIHALLQQLSQVQQTRQKIKMRQLPEKVASAAVVSADVHSMGLSSEPEVFYIISAYTTHHGKDEVAETRHTLEQFRHLAQQLDKECPGHDCEDLVSLVHSLVNECEELNPQDVLPPPPSSTSTPPSTPPRHSRTRSGGSISNLKEMLGLSPGKSMPWSPKTTAKKVITALGDSSSSSSSSSSSRSSRSSSGGSGSGGSDQYVLQQAQLTQFLKYIVGEGIADMTCCRIFLGLRHD
jgi:hypothetical protein